MTFLGFWWLFAQVLGLNPAVELAAFVASLVVFVGGYWAIDGDLRRHGFDLSKVADDLAVAVRQQWQREEEQRRIHDPVALPVRWRPAPEDLADHLANVTLMPVGASVGEVLLDGRIEQVADVYRRGAARRGGAPRRGG